MEQALTEDGGVTPPTDRPGAADQPTWDRYYRDAAQRRQAHGHRRHYLSKEKRRRLRRERVGLAFSALLVGGLTFFFYLVLSR
jgi:hypothetical protein